MLLKQKLEKFVKHIIVLHGGMRAGTRKEMISKLESIPDTEERLILATGQYIGEGFDDPRLDTLFIRNAVFLQGEDGSIRRQASPFISGKDRSANL